MVESCFISFTILMTTCFSLIWSTLDTVLSQLVRGSRMKCARRDWMSLQSFRQGLIFSWFLESRKADPIVNKVDDESSQSQSKDSDSMAFGANKFLKQPNPNAAQSKVILYIYLQDLFPVTYWHTCWTIVLTP